MVGRYAYQAPLPLTAAKLKDLQRIVRPLLSQEAQNSYWNAILNGGATDHIVDNDDDDDDVGTFGDAFDYV